MPGSVASGTHCISNLKVHENCNTLSYHLLHNSPALYIHCPLDNILNWNSNLYHVFTQKNLLKYSPARNIILTITVCIRQAIKVSSKKA